MGSEQATCADPGVVETAKRPTRSADDGGEASGEQSVETEDGGEQEKKIEAEAEELAAKERPQDSDGPEERLAKRDAVVVFRKQIERLRSATILSRWARVIYIHGAFHSLMP